MQTNFTRSLRKDCNSHFVLPTLLVCATLLGLGSQRCAAQFPSGAYSADESTFSIGIFQIQVSPNFAFLFAPAAPGTTYYPGYAPSSGLLTSPIMYDTSTVIGISALDHYPGSFNQTIGSPSGFGSATYNPGNQITGLSDYVAIPFSFVFSTPGFDQVYTEIEAFDLSCPPFGCSTDERVPTSLLNNNELTLVTAGPLSANGFSASDPNNLPLRSIGMVQQTGGAGTTASSFFNINITLSLPEVTQTATINDFPASGFAVLTNDPAQPLVIINTNVTSLPPPVVYIHGMTPAVPLYFKENNPPYWAAGDLFGYVTLAGHGIFPCTNSPQGDGSTGDVTNCCVSAESSGFVGQLLDETLGPVGSPRAGMPILWGRSSNQFPTPNTSYGSTVNTVVDPNTQQTNDLDAKVTFAFGSTLVPVKDVQIGPYPSPISPPASPHTTATYTATGVPVSFEISNSLGWLPATGTGNISMIISNTGSANPSLYYPSGSPQQTYYTVQVTAFNSHDTWLGGPIYLELNTTNPAPAGDFMVSAAGGGYAVSSELNINVRASTDNLNYFASSNYFHLKPSEPPMTPGSLFISVASKTNILVQWQNKFTLQSTTNLYVPFTDVPGPVTSGYWTNNISQRAVFYRLRD